MTAEVVDIDGGPGIVMSGSGRIIATVHNVANPDKLHAVADGVKKSESAAVWSRARSAH